MRKIEDEKRQRAELAALVRDCQKAGMGLPPTIKHISQAPMDITLGGYMESIRHAEREAAAIAVTAILTLINDNKVFTNLPLAIQRRLLTEKIEDELKDRATADTAAPEENARR